MMETRANYVLIGGFTLRCWRALSASCSGSRTSARPRPASATASSSTARSPGLRTGANVNFNGIQIGEVASVKIDDPHKIVMTRRSEGAGAQGHQDRPRVSGLDRHRRDLDEGRPVDAPRSRPDEDGVLTLHADLNSSQDFTEAARAVLQNVNKTGDRKPGNHQSAVKSLQEFAATLDKNSKRIDNVMAGLELMINKDNKGDLQLAINSFKELATTSTNAQPRSPPASTA